MRVVGDTREPATQVDGGGELASLLERSVDRSDTQFGFALNLQLHVINGQRDGRSQKRAH